MPRPNRHFVILNRHQHTPSDSWWIGADRETFSSKAAEESRRMRLSKFGQIQLGTSASDARVERRRLLPV